MLQKVPSVFSEEFKPSDKSRPFTPLDRHFFSKKRAARAVKSAFFRLKKSDVSGGKRRFFDPDIFSEKKPAGTSFHVIVMLVHARKGRGTVQGLEEKRAKVPWVLEEVSL